MSPEVEALLLYETMGSPLVEQTLAATGMSLGKWYHDSPGYGLDENQNKIRHYANHGIPVTFELTEYPDGRIEKTRERATFIWDETFEPFSEWLNTSPDTSEWMDGVFFRTTLPKDFTYTVISQQRRPRGYVNVLESRVHFQPRGYRPSYYSRRKEMQSQYYELPLEVEQAVANIGRDLNMMPSMANSYVTSHAASDNIRNYLDGLGFIEGRFPAPPEYFENFRYSR